MIEGEKQQTEPEEVASEGPLVIALANLGRTEIPCGFSQLRMLLIEYLDLSIRAPLAGRESGLQGVT